MSAPGLVFYYSLLLANGTDFYSSPLSPSSAIVTYTGSIFADVGLTQNIGNFTSDLTVYPKTSSCTGNQTFNLNEGTLTVNANGLYEFYNSGQQSTFQITAGTGDFLNTSGYAVQIIQDTSSTLQVLVYFS